jgi:hypothetical protein
MGFFVKLMTYQYLMNGARQSETLVGIGTVRRICTDVSSRRRDVPKRWIGNRNAGAARALEKFGKHGIMVAVNGYCEVVSMTLNVARVAPPADAEPPFKQAGR